MSNTNVPALPAHQTALAMRSMSGLAPTAPVKAPSLTKEVLNAMNRDGLERVANNDTVDAGLRLHAMGLLRLLDKAAAEKALAEAQARKGSGKDAAGIALRAKFDSIGVPHQTQTVKLSTGEDYEVFVYAGYKQETVKVEGKADTYKPILGADGRCILTVTVNVRTGRFPTTFYPDAAEAVCGPFVVGFLNANPRIRAAANVSRAEKQAAKGKK